MMIFLQISICNIFLFRLLIKFIFLKAQLILLQIDWER